jgi:serine/threonine protein kinase
MELLQGETLYLRLSWMRKLPWQQAVRIGMEVALGLKALHQRGVIHRDLKPGNIWLQDRRREKLPERVKILDFGVARVGQRDDQLTEGFVGTAAYASPEQAAGLKVDKRTDLFSLGTVLYQMVTGHLPFLGDSRDAVLQQVRTQEPIPVGQRVADVPAALSDLIQRLHAKDPQQRFASADEVYQALLRLIEPLETAADLARLRDAWPTLSLETRQAILDLVSGTQRVS